MGEITTKALGPLEIKDADKGEVEAVVATLGVVDRDREIIASDAITDGAKVKLSSYGHDAIFGSAPVGKGAIVIEGDKAIFRGKFFLSTQRGMESYETIKALGSDSEWSFGFRVVSDEVPSEEQQKSGARRVLTKLDAFEVSPVLIGAGIGTGTMAVKEAAKEGVKEAIKEADDPDAVAHAMGGTLTVMRPEDKDEAVARSHEEAKELERIEAESKSAEEAATKQLADAIVLRAQTDEAMEEYRRVQRALSRMGLTK